MFVLGVDLEDKMPNMLAIEIPLDITNPVMKA